MIALTETGWLIVAAMAVLWVISAVRIAVHARRIGRRAALWFCITLLLTAIPALIVFNLEYFRSVRRRGAGPPAAPPRRCPHCRQVIAPGSEIDTPAGAVCPRCRLPVDQETIA